MFREKGVSRKRRRLEEEFELSLLDVLEQDCGLDVRLANDPVNRRRSDVATLLFRYRWSDQNPPRARAIVTIERAGNATSVLPVDFSSPESIERAAEDCEALALTVASYLEEGREQSALVQSSGADAGRRRWDD